MAYGFRDDDYFFLKTVSTRTVRQTLDILDQRWWTRAEARKSFRINEDRILGRHR